MNNRIEAAYEQRPRRWVFELAVALVVAALLIWSGTAVETAGTTQNGAVIAWNILAGIFHPDTDLLFNFTTQGVPYLLLETICIAFLGTIVGAIISIPLAFLSASNLTPKPVAFLGRIIIMAIRTVPAFVYGLMFIRVTGPGAFAGLLTMSLCSVGMVSKMYIEAIEDLDVRVLESLDAAGCTTWQKIRYGILPQLMPNFASTAIYRFDINLKDATTLGIVGGLVLGQAAVSANLISPLLIIVVSVAGLGLFAVPSYPLSLAVRIARLVLVLASTLAGFVGMVVALLCILCAGAAMDSFGTATNVTGDGAVAVIVDAIDRRSKK